MKAKKRKLENAKGKRLNFEKKILVAVVIIAILLVIGLAIAYLRGSSEADDFIVASRGTEGHLPGMTREEILLNLQREADENYIAFRIESRPVFESGTSPGNLNIENPSYNVHPFSVQYFLQTESGERGAMIFDSGMLPSNHHIADERLDIELNPGEHLAIASITFFDVDTHERLAQHEVEVIITIKN